MHDPDDDKHGYYINPKERQLFLLHLYHERIIGEVTVLYAYRYQRIRYRPKLDKRVQSQLELYDMRLGSAIDQGEKLIEKLAKIIEDLEHNV